MNRPGGARLGDERWPEVEAGPSRVLLVPVGSCEQHGPHLPLDTDTRIAVAVATAVAGGRDDVVVAPPLTIGASGEHADFPGTLSIGTEALTDVLVELGRSALPPVGPAASTFAAVVFVNGHGGNQEALWAACARLRAESRAVHPWSPTIPGGDAHAGRSETSLLLAIAPEAVGEARPVGDTAPVGTLADRLRDEGVRAVAPSGVLGDATGASAEEGRAVLASLAEDLAGLVDGLQ